jgi:PAS domain S-box-containing protein
MADNSNETNKTDLLQAIADTTTDALIAIDDAGKVIEWNRAAERIFGFPEKEMLGSSLNMVIPERYRDGHDQGLERVNTGGQRHVIGKTVRLDGKRKDGSEFPLELTVSTWREGERNFYGGIIRDVTEQVRMEENLRTSEERTRSITETANDAIITADSQGLIRSWNLAAARIFGHEASDVIGQTLTLIIPDEFKRAHEEGMRRVAGGGDKHVIGKTVELSGLHKKGHLIPIELSLSTWESDGEQCFGGIIRDISERKRQEQKLLEQQKQLKSKAKNLKRLNDEVKTKNEQLQALSNKLAKYLSRQVYKNIFEGKSDVRIESYRKKLTIFFSDIQGFTELTDRVESEVLTGALNKYLNEMSKIALDHGGTIDKYIGDAIMIFFGDPESLGEREDALACVKMAIDMRKKLIEMRHEWDVLGVTTPLRVRMGINTGFCTVGNFGSEERLDYTIVGGAVNLASRLEGAAETDEILISEDTFSLIKEEIACRPKNEITVKGIAYPVKTYTVIDLVETLEEEREHIKAQLEGFNLAIDFDKLKYSDKLYVREMLQKAMAKLGSDNEE